MKLINKEILDWYMFDKVEQQLKILKQTFGTNIPVINRNLG